MLPLSRALVLILIVSNSFAWGAESESDSTQVEIVPLNAWVVAGEFIGDEQLRRLYVNGGASKFGFRLPTGLYANTANASRITFTEPKYKFFLTMRILTSSPDMLERIERFYPGGKITEEPSLDALNRRATVFKVLWKSPEGLFRVIKVAFVNTPAGVMEISVVSDHKYFGDAQNAMAYLLQTARSNESGALKMETFLPPANN